MDAVGNKTAATEISGIKVTIPNTALRVIDRAIGCTATQESRSTRGWRRCTLSMRMLRIAHGPDEAHR